MTEEKTILGLLHELATVGIWLQRKLDGTVTVGPTNLVANHRASFWNPLVCTSLVHITLSEIITLLGNPYYNRAKRYPISATRISKGRRKYALLKTI